MPTEEGRVGTTSSTKVEVVIGPISLLASVFGGPSISGAAIVDEVGLGCNAPTNISGNEDVVLVGDYRVLISLDKATIQGLLNLNHHFHIMQDLYTHRYT